MVVGCCYMLGGLFRGWLTLSLSLVVNCTPKQKVRTLFIYVDVVVGVYDVYTLYIL